MSLPTEPLTDHEWRHLREMAHGPGAALMDDYIRRLVATIEERDEEVRLMYEAETGLST